MISQGEPTEAAGLPGDERPAGSTGPGGDEPGRRVFVLGPEAAGLRLDKALAERLPEHSRTVVAAWIEAGRVTVAGRVVPGKTRLCGGETVVVDVPPPAPTDLAPEDRALSVLFEDDALLAIDKPAGLTVHPGSGQHDGTLANALVHRWRD